MEKIIASVSSNLQSQKEQFERCLNQNQVGCGWLRFTSPVERLPEVQELIERYFRVQLLPRGKGWNGYLESLQGSFSITIGYTPRLTDQQRQEMGVRTSPNEGFMTTDIPQSALDTLSAEKLLSFWIDVYGIEGVKFTRVDVYYDDYNKLVSPRQVEAAILAGQVAAPRVDLMKPFGKYSMKRREWKGYTVYFGSERSDKQIRFYDKEAESNGKQNCHRWEAELKGSLAKAWQEWFLGQLSEAVGQETVAASADVISNAYKSTIRSAIDFREVSHFPEGQPLPQNWVARSPMPWWWQELLAGLEPAALVVARVKPSLEGKVAWVNNQVMKTLAIVRTAYQHWGIPFTEWLLRGVERGELRWNAQDYRILGEALIVSPAY